MSLKVCSDGHAELCFDDGTYYKALRCPACELKDALSEKSNALSAMTEKADELAEKVVELQGEIADADSQL